MADRNVHEKRILKLARQIAETGRHNGWFHIVMELKLEHGEPLAAEVLEREPYRSELDRRCGEVRKRKYGTPDAHGSKDQKRPAN